MKIPAALKLLMALCSGFIGEGQDNEGGFATAKEICKQLLSFGEEALGRMLKRMNYIRELLVRVNLPSVEELKEFLNKVAQVIDCDAQPFIPNGWKVIEHIKGGKFEWDPSKVVLHLADEQQGSKYIEGNKLRKLLKALKGVTLLNANVLDFLLANPHLIPEEWKGKAIFFWGTIYRDSDGGLYVRYLYWGGGRWRWGCRWLDGDWGSGGPAAVLASKN